MTGTCLLKRLLRRSTQSVVREARQQVAKQGTMQTEGKNTKTGIRIQPPTLTVIHLTAAFLLNWLIRIPFPVPPIFRSVGFLMVLIGFLLGIGAALAFRKSRKEINPNRPESRLITSGVYRLTRNPVNLGFVFMLVGILFTYGSYWGILLAPIMVILFNRMIIEPEEKHLTAKFGQEYLGYTQRVRRWL